MAEYTDLECHSPANAQLVLDYLYRELANEEAPPHITAYAHKSTLRITYHDQNWRCRRKEWDMQLMGFRDGVEQMKE